MNNAAVNSNKDTCFALSQDAIRTIEKILSSKHKVEIEKGRDGIKISEVERKKAYPKI